MGTRAGALKRWKRKGFRQQISRTMRLRYRPKVKSGTVPIAELPPVVIALLDFLTDECLDIVSCVPERIGGHDCWSITVVDGNDEAMSRRYGHYVRESQLCRAT